MSLARVMGLSYSFPLAIRFEFLEFLSTSIFFVALRLYGDAYRFAFWGEVTRLQNYINL